MTSMPSSARNEIASLLRLSCSSARSIRLRTSRSGRLNAPGVTGTRSAATSSLRLGRDECFSTWLLTSVGTGAANNLSATKSVTPSAHLRNILSLSQPCVSFRPINAGRS